MDNYKTLLNSIYNDLINNKIYLNDYIRIRRSKEYNKGMLEKFGALFLPIESYKYDHEIIKMSEKDEYELLKVGDIISELNKTLYFFKQ